MKSKLIMPKATALWLKNNTSLSFSQISEFCGIDFLLLDSLTKDTLKSNNPIKSGELTEEEIKKGEKNPEYRLKNHLNLKSLMPPKSRRKYISTAFKKQKNLIIGWFVKKLGFVINEEKMKKISKALSTNINFIIKIIKDVEENPEEYQTVLDPIKIGVCSVEEVNDILS
ncbi:MAG: cell cycle transcriptional regulator TrcR [Bacteroidota bacterium]